MPQRLFKVGELVELIEDNLREEERLPFLKQIVSSMDKLKVASGISEFSMPSAYAHAETGDFQARLAAAGPPGGGDGVLTVEQRTPLIAALNGYPMWATRDWNALKANELADQTATAFSLNLTDVHKILQQNEELEHGLAGSVPGFAPPEYEGEEY